MKFLVTGKSYNATNLMRRLGYHAHGKSFSRRLTRAKFPRFHVYLKELEDALEISIHLDQKGPCYPGQTAHSGDYNNSEVLEMEKERIIKLLDN